MFNYIQIVKFNFHFSFFKRIENWKETLKIPIFVFDPIKKGNTNLEYRF